MARNTVESLVIDAHENAVKHGFWEDLQNTDNDLDLEWHKIAFKNPVCEIDVNAISTRLMLIVGEVAEAQEGLRHNDRSNFAEELADIVIRVFDLAGGLDIDLEVEIIKKMATNASRPYKHGKSF